jgi:hypothetical protein
MLRLLRQDDATFDGGHVAGQKFASSGSKPTVFTYRTATHCGRVTFIRMHLSPFRTATGLASAGLVPGEKARPTGREHIRGEQRRLSGDALIVVDEVHYLMGAPKRSGAAVKETTLQSWRSFI